MLFNSLHFLIFFAVLFIAYYAVPSKYRRYLLLFSSCYFYMVYVPAYILILFFLILTDFFLGLQIEKNVGRRKKSLLIISIITNIGILFIFKYFNFFNENIAALAQLIHWNYSTMLLQVALPLGLSFHVFQSLSYVIEVYWGKVPAEKNLGIYALYVMFFSQLVAGPIERPNHLLPQLHKEHAFNSLQVRKGLEIMLIGFFKKLVIADHLALLVDHVYGNLGDANSLMMVIAAIAFTYQLYCDFSGYSDIAVGSALVFGYDLTNNFHRPFSARTIAEFWRRWHISLSSWLRDYLYHPLVFSGSKISKTRLYTSLFFTFVLIGLWHGANWTYVAMGAIHGGYLVFSALTVNARKHLSSQMGFSQLKLLQHCWQIFITYTLVTVSFIFFRAVNIADALQILSRIRFLPRDILELNVVNFRAMMTPEGIGIGIKTGAMLVGAILFLELVQYIQEKKNTPHIFEEYSRTVRFLWYFTLIFLILCFGYFGAQVFIYFQF